MTIGELKEIINGIDDDFRLEIDIMHRIPLDELMKSKYPYPWDREDATIEFHDIGYSDKIVCFGVYPK